MTQLKMNDYTENFKNCLQYEKPYCQAECPFHIDIKDFIEKLKNERYNSAYKVYRDAVGFPRIVSRICSQPCQGPCPMKDYGGAIELKKVEQATIENTTRTAPQSYNVPSRPGKVAIIGSGLAGLGALLRMATKKYETHIFEMNDSIGGNLKGTLDSSVFEKDIEEQLKNEKYELHLSTEIKDRNQINSQGFDVVFVATGKGGKDFGLLESVNDSGHKYILKDGETAWFAGGELVGDDGVYALAGGLYMGLVLDAYLKTKNLNYEPNIMKTDVLIDHSKIRAQESTIPRGEIYTKEELAEEANRCIQCQCNFCRTYEDLTTYKDKWPIRIKDEVVATTLEGMSEVKQTPAKRLMSTSNLTGIVKDVCPMDIDLDNLILSGRQKMHKLEKAPWVFHDFWLRDMDFSNSENASVVKNAPGAENSELVFFPGCQLGAGMPELVGKTYELLLSINKNTGLITNCCAAPAEWSGNDEKHEAEIEKLRKQLSQLGDPTLIAACPTCIRQFKKNLPAIKVISIYEHLDNADLELKPEGEITNMSIFDPCSTREQPEIKAAVRSLITKLNVDNTELPNQSEVPRCCSFGGQPEIADPDYADYVINQRIEENNLPYVTYCINCQDSFDKKNKDSSHLLGLILGVDRKQLPTVTQRRENRIRLKRNLLKDFWGEDMNEEKAEYNFILVISEEILDEMNREKILEEEVYNVVDFLIRTKRQVCDSETGIYSGYRQIGYMTYWVSYKKTEKANVYEVVDVYTHRMEIELEGVWNGVKTEIDV